MARIEIDGLRKVFQRHTAVRGLDLTIEDGELLVLLGPSGCGKTTTLNCIAGLETPTAGRVLFDGEDVTEAAPHQRNIAMVFQSSLLYPHLTARQNIRTSLAKQKLGRAEENARIGRAAATLGIEDLLDKLPSELSGGERQRVATAKAIVRQPRVFLLDEPLAALDAALRLTLRAELVNLQKRLATTMVVVTHDQVEAMTMGDRIAVMNEGRLEQIGTPDEIYGAPATRFVASFVGSPPMNLIAGELHGDGSRFVSGDLGLRLPGGGPAATGPLTLGVRPQHLRIHSHPGEGTIPVTVFAVEHLGRESVVILEDDDRNRLRALVEPGFFGRVGDRLHAAPDPASCLLFDETGAAVPGRAPVPPEGPSR